MAPRNQQSEGRGPINGDAAEDIVLDNLGMSRTELGMDNENDDNSGDDNSGDDQDQGNDLRAQDQNDRGDGRDDNDDGDERQQHLDDRQQHRNNIMRDRNGQQNGQQRQPKPFPKNGEVRADGKGNIVNAEGKIVAKAGKEARLYTDLHKSRQQLSLRESHIRDTTTKLNRAVEIATELNDRVQAFEAREATIRELGLTPAEQLEAVQLFNEGKREPLQVLKKLLTRAAASGIDISTLGAQPGGFDPKSLMDLVKSEIANHLKPLKDRSEAESRQSQQEKETEATRTKTVEHVRSFFKDNEDALPYVPAFKALMEDNRFRHMPLSEMWTRIQNQLLRVQLEQRQNGNGQNRRNRNRPSLPNGRGGRVIANGESDIANPSQTYDEILRGVMQTEYQRGR